MLDDSSEPLWLVHAGSVCWRIMCVVKYPSRVLTVFLTASEVENNPVGAPHHQLARRLLPSL